MQAFYELAGLFASAFLSATILPGSSEAVLIGVMALGTVATWQAVAVATVGNVMGSLLNWAIGFFFGSYRDHPRFPLSQEKFEKYADWFRRWGVWSLFLSWVPLIGDALTIVSGVMRCNVFLVALIVFIAKGARYIVVATAAGAVL
jgi:membrane protein YqaA with SNARE-associated domain